MRRRPRRRVGPASSVLGRIGRIVGRLLAVAFGFAALATAILAVLFWQSLPPSGMHLQVAGLAQPVAITLDADGIPRIVAGSEPDAAAALGFMHARDRMFQMELMRHAASGRLSEIAGSATLRLDRTMRVLGLRVRAEADYAALDATTRAMLDAYAAGVNAWIAARGRFAAPEFIRARRAGAVDAGRQPAVGQDDGPLSLGQLAVRAGPRGAAGQAARRPPARAVAAAGRNPTTGCAAAAEPGARGHAPG